MCIKSQLSRLIQVVIVLAVVGLFAINTGHVYADTIVGQITLSSEVGASAVDFVTNQVYLAHPHNNTITVIDGRTYETTTLIINGSPAVMAFNPINGKVYVAHYQSNTVTVIDSATHAMQTIVVGDNPEAIAVNTVTGRVYVANT